MVVNPLLWVATGVSRHTASGPAMAWTRVPSRSTHGTIEPYSNLSTSSICTSTRPATPRTIRTRSSPSPPTGMKSTTTIRPVAVSNSVSSTIVSST